MSNKTNIFDWKMMVKSGFYLKIIFTFRPVIKEVKPKNLKQDPVKLHQFYKEHWEKTRLPGKSK